MDRLGFLWAYDIIFLRILYWIFRLSITF